MNTDPRVHYAPPLQKAAAAKPAKAPRSLAKSILRNLDPTPLCTIQEDTASRRDPRVASLHAEARSLKASVSALAEQRNDALEALDSAVTSASAAQKANQAHISENIHLRYRAEDLEGRNRVLSERCKTLAALGDKHQLPASVALQDKISALELRGREQSHQLNTALSALANADARHAALKSAHADLAARHAASDCAPSLAGLTQSALEARAAKAERDVQTLLAARKLALSAPISAQLADKAPKVLRSATDVLALFMQGSPEPPKPIREGLAQIHTALSQLADELACSGAEAGAWLARRDALLPARV
jgi:hypothetical protein